MNRNILENVNLALAVKHSMTDGLSSYTQSNCKCSITSDGYYRIYRTPNTTFNSNDSSTRTMWGGLVINFNNYVSSLIKTHRYLIRFLVKGKSNNALTSEFLNNRVGWNGGGLVPNPSDIKSNWSTVFATNFNYDDWVEFYYAFTINDDVYKVCTTSYSSFTAGETYLSYRSFKFGWGYSSTGEWGTEVFIKDIQMVDITNKLNGNAIKKNGCS